MSAVTKLRQPATNQKPVPALDQIDVLDLVNTRHQQAQGILASIFMGLSSTNPSEKLLKNAIYAVQDLLEEAEDAVVLLGRCDSESLNECKECK